MRAVIEPLAPTADDWQAFVASLRRYVQRRVDPTFADDVLGNILLRLVEHRDALQDADNPSAWMFRVAANAITDHYRRSATEARVLAESGADSLKDIPAPSPTGSSADAELSQCLVPLIRSLPESYAEALLLTDIEGLTQVEAARRLGLSLSGMKSRVQRGRARLRQALLRCCKVHLDRRGGVLEYEPRSRTCSC